MPTSDTIIATWDNHKSLAMIETGEGIIQVSFVYLRLEYSNI
tara:strand:+ start:1021 stop:1146 length:126 start_codon:yes stop_codon:yes gene_type:complete